MSDDMQERARRRYRDPFAWDIDVSKDGEPLHGVWIAGTRREAIEAARREGRRMARGPTFRSVRMVVRRRRTGRVVFDHTYR